jgi:hypothetical protein
MAKVYHGTRTPDGCRVTVHEVYIGAPGVPLDPCNDIRNHSPCGFNWGYGGSGPAQLALALCVDATGSRRIEPRIYQAVKFRLVGRLDDDEWCVTQQQIITLIQEIEADEQK